MAQMIKNIPAVQKTQESSETWVPSLGQEDPLEEEMATHSSILAWRVPMDRGAWWATVQGVTESDVTVHAWSSMHTYGQKWCCEKGPTGQPGFLMDKNAGGEPREGTELTSMRRSQEEDFWLTKAKNLKTNEELTWKNGLEYWVHWSGQRPGKQPSLLSECLLTRSLWAASRLPRRDLSVWVSERQTRQFCWVCLTPWHTQYLDELRSWHCLLGGIPLRISSTSCDLILPLCSSSFKRS